LGSYQDWKKKKDIWNAQNAGLVERIVKGGGVNINN